MHPNETILALPEMPSSNDRVEEHLNPICGFYVPFEEQNSFKIGFF